MKHTGTAAFPRFWRQAQHERTDTTASWCRPPTTSTRAPTATSPRWYPSPQTLEPGQVSRFHGLLRSLILIVLAVALAAVLSRTESASANPLAGVTAIAAGGAHTCALNTTGGVKCWGNNSTGQVGDGDPSTADRGVPVNVFGLKAGVAALSLGSNYSCALTTAGSVKCWGLNDFGQLGDGTSDGPEKCIGNSCSTVPVAVMSLTDGVTAIAAGVDHTCAVISRGGVKCWGSNRDGQLGNGTHADSSTSVDVVGLETGAISVSAGYGHSCALTVSNGVKCWGLNAQGQLGNGTTSNSLTPVDVSGLASGAAAISAGYSYTCAVTTAHGVKCWGNGLGGGNAEVSNTPIDVTGLPGGAAAVSAGYDNTCAISSSGGVKCWGPNDNGQLGNGTTTNSRVPVDVSGLASGVVAVSTGGAHACALTIAGGIKCWGRNSSRELGTGGRHLEDCPVFRGPLPCSTIPVDVESAGSLVAAGMGRGSENSDTTAWLLLALLSAATFAGGLAMRRKSPA